MIRLTSSTYFIFLVFLFPLFLFSQTPQGLLIRDVRVVHVERAEVVPTQQVWIVNDTIRAISSLTEVLPPALDTIEAGGRYLMPGLIDAHVHYFQSGGLYTRPDVIDLRTLQSYDAERQWLTQYAPDLWRRYIAAGITGTIDMGGPFKNYDLRKQAHATAAAPTLWVTGPLLSSYLPAELDTDDPPILNIETPEDGRAEVRRQLPFQPDLIKIWYIVFPGQTPATFEPIAAAIIDEAHQHDLPVAVHATQLATARTAVRLGADILVHSIEDQRVDSSFVALLLQQGTYYCPTLTVGESYEEVLTGNLDLRADDWAVAHPTPLGSLFDLNNLPEDQLPMWVQSLRNQPYERPKKIATMQANLYTLSRAGVPIITGTDAGNIGTLHAASYAEELGAMIEAGLSNHDILRACTSTPARMMGYQGGHVKVGCMADLLLLDSNPLFDAQVINRPTLVFKRGRAYEPKQLLALTPLEIVQSFLNGWRSGDQVRLQRYLHPSVIFRRRGRQFAGRTGVGLIWQNKRIPIGSPTLSTQEDGSISVHWGNATWIFVVSKGTIRQIEGP